MSMTLLSYEVYSEEAEHIASVRHASDAAALLAVLGEGFIEYRTDDGRRTGTVWNTAHDGPTSESYDASGHTMISRGNAIEHEHTQAHVNGDS